MPAVHNCIYAVEVLMSLQSRWALYRHYEVSRRVVTLYSDVARLRLGGFNPPPKKKNWSNPEWRRNEFESGGGAQNRRLIFCRAPLTFFAQSTVSRFGDGQYTFGQFLVCCSSTHGAPPVPSHF